MNIYLAARFFAIFLFFRANVGSRFYFYAAYALTRTTNLRILRALARERGTILFYA